MTNIPASLPEKEIYRHSLSNNRLEKIASLTELGDTGVITGSLRLQHQWVMFTATGSYILDPVTGKLRRFSRLNIKTVTSPETIKGMHGYTTIPATYGMSIPALATSNIFSFFHPSIWDISM